MRQPLRQLNIPEPWQQQKQQSEHSLHEQELKRITDSIPAVTKRTTIIAEKQASRKPHQTTSMEFASLKWNAEMNRIFDIVEIHLISLRWLWS